jgi:hypothetical protein
MTPRARFRLYPFSLTAACPEHHLPRCHRLQCYPVARPSLAMGAYVVRHGDDMTRRRSRLWGVPVSHASLHGRAMRLMLRRFR